MIHLKTTSMKTILFFSLTLFVLFFAACDLHDDMGCDAGPDIEMVRDSTFWKKQALEAKARLQSYEGDYVFMSYEEDTLSKPSFAKVTLNLKMQNDSTLLGTGKSFVNQYSVLFIYNKYRGWIQTQALSQTELAGEVSLMNEEVVFLNLINQTNYVNLGGYYWLLSLTTSQRTPSNTFQTLYFKKKRTSN
jgi:hypothetical protein